MSKTYQVHVFGNPGCPKCHTLNGRLDDMLQEEKWTDFEKVYHDLETESGLVQFCDAECLNPQRVPGFYISKADPDSGQQAPLPNPAPGVIDAPGGSAALYSWVGMQTDYTPAGNGVISPKMIEAVLGQAQSL